MSKSHRVSWVRRLFGIKRPDNKRSSPSFKVRLSLQELEARDLPSSSTFPLYFSVPADTAGQSVYASLYAELETSYTNPAPSSPTLDAGTWVYLETNGTYAAASSVGSIPYFLEFPTTSATTNLEVDIPNVIVESAHIVFGIGAAPSLPVESGAVPEPVPSANVNNIYDFVEFTLDDSGPGGEEKLTINTSSVDQFGLPITINTTPTAITTPLGTGVIQDRTTVMSEYETYVASDPAFQELYEDAFGDAPPSDPSDIVRILSPNDELTQNPVTGLVIADGGGGGSLTPGDTYYYQVTATNGSGETKFSDTVYQFQAVSSSISLAWGSYAGATGYNVYRGVVTGGSITWYKVGSTASNTFTDNVTTPAPDTNPPVDPLATYLDSSILAFFNKYSSTATMPQTLTMQSTYGDTYTLTGQTTNGVLVLTVKTAVEPNGTADPGPPIPINTQFDIYEPFFNTNTYDPNNPAPPAFLTAVYNNNVSATGMAFAAEGVFADSTQQFTPGTDEQIVLGSLENQIDAAIIRGIATSTTIQPPNWSLNPIQLTPTGTTVSGGALTSGTTYYYEITAFNAYGESTNSVEFSVTLQSGQNAVNVNWEPQGTSFATYYNIYRGTAPGQEQFVGSSATNTLMNPANTYLDTGTPTTTVSPPSFYPSGTPSDTYDAFFHQSTVNQYGLAYASAFDDQGNFSTTIAVLNPTGADIDLGAWGPSSASPTLTTTPNPTTVTSSSALVTLTDTADLESGNSPTGTITFTLYYGSTLLDTETAAVSGNGAYTTPSGYTPITGLAAGTYQWDAAYSGDSNNNGVSDNNAPNEQVTVSFTSPNTAFVYNVYRQLLERAPDPGSQYWVNLLNNGASPQSIVRDIENSTEYLSDQITADYVRYLNRQPDPAGFAHWLAYAQDGHTLTQVAAEIIGSTEFFLLHGGTNSAYVTALYNDLFGRTPAAGELNDWLVGLNAGGSRYNVAIDFLNSTEYRLHLLDAYYQTFLLRAPDPSGLANWLGSMAQGMTYQEVLAAIFGSAEGLSKWS